MPHSPRVQAALWLGGKAVMFLQKGTRVIPVPLLTLVS